MTSSILILNLNFTKCHVSVHNYRRGGVLGRRVCDGQRLPADGPRQAGVQTRGGGQEPRVIR